MVLKINPSIEDQSVCGLPSWSRLSMSFWPSYTSSNEDKGMTTKRREGLEIENIEVFVILPSIYS